MSKHTLRFIVLNTKSVAGVTIERFHTTTDVDELTRWLTGFRYGGAVNCDTCNLIGVEIVEAEPISQEQQ